MAGSDDDGFVDVVVVVGGSLRRAIPQYLSHGLPGCHHLVGAPCYDLEYEGNRRGDCQQHSCC